MSDALASLVVGWGWLSEPAWVRGCTCDGNAGTQAGSENRPHLD